MKNFAIKIFLFITLVVLLHFKFYGQDRVRNVKVTSYKIIGKTASGERTDEINEPFVAVSRDLLQIYPLGSYIYLSKCKWEGLYKVMDKMGRKHKNMFDVFSQENNTGIVDCECSQVY